MSCKCINSFFDTNDKIEMKTGFKNLKCISSMKMFFTDISYNKENG